MVRAILVAVAIVCSSINAIAAPSASEVGRFQIVLNPSVRADTFLLDTETGRVWRLVKYTDLKDQPEAWEFMDRLDDVGEMKAFGRVYGETAPQTDPPQQ